MMAIVTFFLASAEVSAWQPAAGPLASRWAREVSPTNVLPEYPRPQLVRKAWTNLNGLWQYAVRPAQEGQPKSWDGDILVPFAIESTLSGVKKAVQPTERLWYRRTFTPAVLAKKDRLLLHFGAVDWECRVWVNGKEVGLHTGGYDSFTFDISEAIGNHTGESELVVAVSDPTDTGTQPRGKQVLKPHGIYYTAVTGIWQTVWLEPVPATHIRSLHIVPDIDRGLVRVKVEATGDAAAQVEVLDGKNLVVEKQGRAGQEIELPIPGAKLWSPDDPHLYDLRVRLSQAGKPIDAVSSYFGMRKIEVRKDSEGFNRLWLNNKVVFQYGPLDQGWWPDGLYTAPTDAALKFDIEFTKRFGMNMARKHVKIEPDRWYYWCDKLGLLVWQDMPSGEAHQSPASQANYRRELQAMIVGCWNHPSIVMWVPFNEGWGQHDTAEVAAWVKQLDPTRPVNESSGWNDAGSGDISDMHNYPGPGTRKPEWHRACVLGEFGGLGLPVSGHTWQKEKNWGYVSYANSKELTDAYVDLLARMRPLIRQGLSAAVYTQTTDCEIEVNGLITYDREQVKMDEPRSSEAARKLYLSPPTEFVLAAANNDGRQMWRFTLTRPADRWEQADFDDHEWNTGRSGFGTNGTPHASVRTEWNTPEIWLRRTFQVDTLPNEFQLLLTIHHDEDAEVYLNGTLVRTLKGHTQHYQPILLDTAASKLLRKGNNSIAVHCRQTTGGQYIDVGLSALVETPAPQ
ncbi:MAG: glycoside hydrolase family 2 [Pirellulales bacterium]|nr:glycoside hydrolase family 2 [Pirellulales bacterium]